MDDNTIENEVRAKVREDRTFFVSTDYVCIVNGIGARPFDYYFSYIYTLIVEGFLVVVVLTY